MNAILAGYAELAATVARMVELAREGRWDGLPGLDTRCSALFDRLCELGGDDLSPSDSSRIVALTRRIRADQDALAALVRPQFTHLMQTMARLEHAA